MASFDSSATLNPDPIEPRMDSGVKPTVDLTSEEIVVKKPASKRKTRTTTAEDSPVVVKKEEEKEPVLKKSKKVLLAEKYGAFAKANHKNMSQIHVSKPAENVFETYKKYFEDPTIIKSYCLPLFHFLDVYEIPIHTVSSFETVTVQTTAGNDKIQELSKLSKELALPEESLELIRKKYGKKHWKVPAKDYKRIRELLEKEEIVHIRLVGVEVNEFTGKTGELCVSLNPRLEYF